MELTIERTSTIKRSGRVSQVEGMFDLKAARESRETWHVNMPIEEREWSVGLIVGPSGCGKTTIAREAFGAAVCDGFQWDPAASLIDSFPKSMGIKDITELLSSVGFAAPPQWLRPFHVLSTGQQMRVTVARLLAEQPDLAVMDEFTSVVDRTVAKIGSLAIAKAVRRRGQKFVAVTCHEDVEKWLQPDWIYRPETGIFRWRSVQRPHLDIIVSRCDRTAWSRFKAYHYLTGSLSPQSQCYGAWVVVPDGERRGQPEMVAFLAVTQQPGISGMKRIHRVVCLPEYQGAGVGGALMREVGAIYRGMGMRIVITSSLPSINVAFSRSPMWLLKRAPGLTRASGRTSTLKMTHATSRFTASWEYVGPALPVAEANSLVVME